MHITIKILPWVEGLLQKKAQVFITTCNPTTVQDEVVAYLQQKGAQVEAKRDMSARAYEKAIHHALDWNPTHVCEMGADLTFALHQRAGSIPNVLAGLEATGSGIARLQKIKLRYPVFNWDDLPIKEGLHNRYLVGLGTWHTFFERTRLTLHGKRVLVIGYGSVGRGLADAARAYGGTVCVAERDAARALEARYAGWEVRSLSEALSLSDVIVTATGAQHVLRAEHFSLLKNGVFLLNVGHRADEIDLPNLLAYPHDEALPFVEAIRLDNTRTVYLFAGGSMANLTAGKGDSLNSFDLTLAVMAMGIAHIIGAGAREAAGVHLLPRSAWEPVIQSFDL
jgi:adenosylhomocysteinase